MKRKNIELNLKRKTFDEVISNYLNDFLKIEGNYEEHCGERFLKEEVPFYPQLTPQRNPHQVPNKIWKELIRQHCFSISIN
jgi:hypothetical protein